LASAPGLRHSNRHSAGRSERMARTAQERFSYPQVALIGANHPGTKRFYEFTLGFRSREAPGRCSSTPAMAAPNAGGTGSAASGAANAFV
jgi:hypothetical protein